MTSLRAPIYVIQMLVLFWFSSAFGCSCSEYRLGDGNCDVACFNQDCGYDYGDCESSAEECGGCEDYGSDGVCQSKCFTTNCLYDTSDCLATCSDGCTLSMVNDGWCNDACFTSACSDDGQDCEDYCATSCSGGMKGDGECDDACNVEDCDFDEGDCSLENDTATLLVALGFSLIAFSVLCICVGLGMYMKHRAGVSRRQVIHYNQVRVEEYAVNQLTAYSSTRTWL